MFRKAGLLRVGLCFPLSAPVHYLVALLGLTKRGSRCVAMPLNIHAQFLSDEELSDAFELVEVAIFPEMASTTLIDVQSRDAVHPSSLKRASCRLVLCSCHRTCEGV
ncbi:ppsA [Symbiodinium pilosum]|uniref:PpsA protein n=1 Tax=Symbiodinium pilosum TaxID=2952 RepID=A0A812WVP9_SYMPI|nr:ppsA [Symbiodinium pilosum]